MNNTSRILWVIGIILIVVAAACIGYRFGQRDEQSRVVYSDLVSRPVETGKIIQLNFGTQLPVPDGWKITLREYGVDSQFARYEVNTGVTTFSLEEIKVSEWAKGPLENQGYVVPAKERGVILSGLKHLYERQKIDATFTKIFAEQAGEFFGYASKMRVGQQYFASADNHFRGLSFFNTYGQSPVLSPIYHVVVYNAEADVILVAYHDVGPDAPEIAVTNKQIEAGMQGAALNVMVLDEKVHADFKTLVETKSRGELSFGPLLNEVDALVKSAYLSK